LIFLQGQVEERRLEADEKSDGSPRFLAFSFLSLCLFLFFFFSFNYSYSAAVIDEQVPRWRVRAIPASSSGSCGDIPEDDLDQQFVDFRYPPRLFENFQTRRICSRDAIERRASTIGIISIG